MTHETDDMEDETADAVADVLLDLNNGDFEKAIEGADKILASTTDPEWRAMTLGDKGCALYHMKRFPEAVAALRVAVDFYKDSDPQFIEALKQAEMQNTLAQMSGEPDEPSRNP